MPLTSLEHHDAVMAYRAACNFTRLKATLETTAIACEEAKTALLMAGDPDQRLIDALTALIIRLSTAAKESEPTKHD